MLPQDLSSGDWQNGWDVNQGKLGAQKFISLLVCSGVTYTYYGSKRKLRKIMFSFKFALIRSWVKFRILVQKFTELCLNGPE